MDVQRGQEASEKEEGEGTKDKKKMNGKWKRRQ